jgi:hypothetical protein
MAVRAFQIRTLTATARKERLYTPPTLYNGRMRELFQKADPRRSHGNGAGIQDLRYSRRTQTEAR